MQEQVLKVKRVKRARLVLSPLQLAHLTKVKLFSGYYCGQEQVIQRKDFQEGTDSPREKFQLSRCCGLVEKEARSSVLKCKARTSRNLRLVEGHKRGFWETVYLADLSFWCFLLAESSVCRDGDTAEPRRTPTFAATKCSHTNLSQAGRKKVRS